MLVLTRQRDQEVEIDEGRIRVQVLEIRGDKVRLGFTAPPDVSIHRAEFARKLAEGRRLGITTPCRPTMTGNETGGQSDV